MSKKTKDTEILADSPEATSRRAPSIYDELQAVAIDNYVIDRYLGEGGQAVVFLAHGRETKNNYALKVFGLIDTDVAKLQVAFSEAKNQSLIEHPSIVRVYEPGIADVEFQGSMKTLLFIPMQYAPLGSCEDSAPFKDVDLRVPDVDSLIGLLDGLSFIHKANIIHLDIKPANILRFQERHGGVDEPVLRITDFGMAKVLYAMTGGGEPTSGLTPEYMAPEQLEGTLSQNWDVYSMGATLYYMLTGQQPIDGTEPRLDLHAWQKYHLEQARPNAMDHNPRVPPRIALLIMQMMSVEPSARPSLEECIEVLRSYLDALSQKALGFKTPELLKRQLESDEHLIRYTPGFREIFHPAVHLLCGTVPYVVRVQMLHPVFSQYRRLIEFLVRRFADCFSLYEAYGYFDIHIFLWSDEQRIKSLGRSLEIDFAGSKVDVNAAKQVHHIHADEMPRRAATTIVGALAVQEGIRVPDLDEHAYLCGRYPVDNPEHSIRAFTYVEAVTKSSVNPQMLRVAIVESVRQRMLELIKVTIPVKQDGQTHGETTKPRFPRISIVELTDTDRSEQPVVLVNFVSSDYKYIQQIPTAIIELGKDAVKTSTFLETGRIVIQSDKISF